LPGKAREQLSPILGASAVRVSHRPRVPRRRDVNESRRERLNELQLELIELRALLVEIEIDNLRAEEAAAHEEEPVG
jgi:hypothetical protein